MSKKRSSEELFENRRGYYYEIQHRGLRHPDFDWPSTELIINLLLVNTELQAYVSERLARYGLSISSFNILTILSRRKKEACFLHELSDLLLVSRANVTGLIDKLVRQKYVVRRLHEDDRRKCSVRITAAGEKLLEKIFPDHLREINAIAGVFSAREKRQLNGFLTRLSDGVMRRRSEE
jgi:MarR family 2-MHQ and catechol resistance regulon transcriptional repressor